jgi:iron complex transport system substrate-binding protein
VSIGITGKTPWLLALLITISGAGCGASGANQTKGGVTGSATAFPVTVHGAGGATVLRAAPQRIVSLSPTTTEDLFAIGAGRQVRAVDDQSNFPKSAPHTSLSALEPNLEAIAVLRPDLVVISDDGPPTLAPGLRKLGLKVVIDPAARTLGDAYGQIVELGRATGHAAAARALVTRMRSKIGVLAQSARASDQHRSVYDEITPDFYAASSSTFVGKLMSMFGLHNIADAAPDPTGVGYPKLSAEYVLAANPEVVLLSDSNCCKQSASVVARRPGWARMAAVRDHNVLALGDDIASRWGPRTVNLAALIVRASAPPTASTATG